MTRERKLRLCFLPLHPSIFLSSIFLSFIFLSLSFQMFALLVLPLVATLPADVNSHLAMALHDVTTRVAPTERQHTRYLSLLAVDDERCESATAGVSLVLNSVSRARRIVRPAVVPGSGGRLLRISLADYKLPAELWEAALGSEPYWHLSTKVVDPRTGKPREVITDGGWVDLAAAAKLRLATGSAGAIVRADWFVARSATTANGGLYYALVGVPEKEIDFFRQLGIDPATIGKLRADEGANLFHSQVTGKLRRIVRRPGPLGAAWETLDVERSTAERDPIRNPAGFTYDAGEHIAAKANGLHLFALYDSQGRRADSVPDRIAKDTSDPHGEGIIVPMISCVRCHREDGLRPFVNDQQRLLKRGVRLYADDRDVAERLAAFYDTDLGKQLRRDREDYAEAVAQATGGLKSEEAADALAALFRGYVYERVSPRQAARELGLAEGGTTELARILAASHDPVLLALTAGIAVQREQWEAGFAEAAGLVEGSRKDEGGRMKDETPLGANDQ